MDNKHLERILRKLTTNKITLAEALTQLQTLPYENIGLARIDHHRALRQGFPEVILGEGKSLIQIKKIFVKLIACNTQVLITRVNQTFADSILAEFPQSIYYPQARIVAACKPEKSGNTRKKRTILILTAGTADIPVAEEARITLLHMGQPVETIYDVGVAGLHRILDCLGQIRKASVIIVIAGMEGALASVVGGLVQCPVIAVPTSVGYGSSYKGLSALLGMLNSCSAGVTVVNIDNGFGAAYAATVINRL